MPAASPRVLAVAAAGQFTGGLLIAATAHAHAARVYTRNAAVVFRGLEDLVTVAAV